MIYLATDKNAGTLCRGAMRRFQGLIDDLQLSELMLSGRLFAWSNGRDRPTLECLDRAFCTVEWQQGHPCHQLRCLSSDCSDHTPLLLVLNTKPWVVPRFHFERYWTKIEGFFVVVNHGLERIGCRCRRLQDY